MGVPNEAPRARPQAGETFDAIIIGTGQAASPLANRLTAAGMTVAVIERAFVGGTCVNTGCTPTKAMVASAYVARMAARGAEYGVILSGDTRVDMNAVIDRVVGIVSAARTGVEEWLSGMKGCTFIHGHASFEKAHEVRVGGRHLRASKIFLNVGGRARIPDISGLSDVTYFTNSDIVNLRQLPRHLVIIGGSYIGLEFAQMFRRFGAQVTVIEQGDRLVAREDEDVSEEIKRILEREGVTIRLDAKCIRVFAHKDGVGAGTICTSGNSDVMGSHLLLAVGRRPNTDDLGLEKAGVKRNQAGYVVVDDQLRTNVEGIWALGDCNGRGAFTHTAYDDFHIVAGNLLDGDARSVADRIPAYGLYIDPPLGRVGMTVSQARATGRKVRVGMRPMTRVARAIEKGEVQGFMRIVVDAESDAILGGTVLGPGGDEAIHEILAAMAARTPASRFARTMAIHPTVSELLPTIAGELSAPL